jgi:hypothetical protein
MVIEQ